MNAHRVGVLAAVTAVALVAALWTTTTRRPQQESERSGVLIEGLAGRLDAIDKVVLTGAGKSTLATLQKSADGWTVLERAYPADTAKLRELLRGLAEARKVEAKTANPQQHAKLGVEDIEGKDAYGVLVELSAGDRTDRWIVGQNTVRGQGTYLRAADQPQSWQIDRSISVEKNAANWLHKDLVDIAVERIEQVDVSALQGPAISIVRADTGEGDFKLREVPKGREPASDFVADATAGLLSQLKLDDVAVAGAVQIEPATRREATFKTRDGITVAVDSWQANEKTYARLQATFDEAAAKTAIAAAQDDERKVWEAKQAAAKPAGDAAKTEGDAAAEAGTPPAAVADAAADAETRLQRLRDEVAQMSARFEGRVFVLPNHKAANLNRDLEAYLKPKA